MINFSITNGRFKLFTGFLSLSTPQFELKCKETYCLSTLSLSSTHPSLQADSFCQSLMPPLFKLQISSFVFDAPQVQHLEDTTSSSISSFSANVSQDHTIVEPSSSALKMTAKRYTLGFSGDNTFGLTLLFAHGVGSHKEQWEPTIERIFLTQAAKDRHQQIREAWSFDWQNHGDTALVNEEALKDRPEGVSIYVWASAITDFVRSPRMAGHRIVPLGHSAGAGAM
ncbi:hypothetical protein GGU11DRAFT_240822 [Lentinula aff. detonsa]|nr:hypothetical protein GGU11DRAFT_240822 [Lentinula aff. detonsa]